MHEMDGIIVQPPVYYRYKQAADRTGRKTIYNPLKLVNGLWQFRAVHGESEQSSDDSMQSP